MKVGFSLLNRLLLAFLLPTIILVGGISLFVYSMVGAHLENELGLRLESVAAAVTAVSGLENSYYLLPGDDNTRTFANIQRKLEALKKATDIDEITIVDGAGYILISTKPNTLVGQKFYRGEIDAFEISEAREKNHSQSALFTGKDNTYYKNGYAVLAPPQESQFEGVVPAVVAVAGSPTYFYVLDDFKKNLFAMILAILLIITVFSILIARGITRPVTELVDVASNIAGGNFEEPIKLKSGGEIAFLAQTMEEMREAIFKREQQMQQMLSGIAHEIRNPLSGLELFLGLLEEDLDGQEEHLKKVDRLKNEVNYLKRVVEDFLSYARQSPPDKREFKLITLVCDVKDLVIKQLADKNAVCEMDIPETLKIKADDELLKQAFMNLLLNAAGAVGENGLVRVTAKQENEEIKISIEDDGKGISEDIKEKIFEPFFTTKPKGTGLGLAFTKKIIQVHGGRISLGRGELSGAMFEITLPKE